MVHIKKKKKILKKKKRHGIGRCEQPIGDSLKLEGPDGGFHGKRIEGGGSHGKVWLQPGSLLVLADAT